VNEGIDSLAALTERLRRRAPAYFDLITSDSLEEFEAAFNALLETAIFHMEKNSRNLASLDEEGLTAVLAGTLTMPGLVVTQEQNSNGHVDLTIEVSHCTPARTKLGEAKIYSGPKYHIKGMGQLLGRYTTGRETSGLLINYVRQANIARIATVLMAELDTKLPEDQVGSCQGHTLKWSFTTKHRHSSGEILSLSHVACNLHF